MASGCDARGFPGARSQLPNCTPVSLPILRAVHIVHVIARLNDGGPVRVLAALLPELQRLGLRITVLTGVCGPDEPDCTAWLQAHGVVVERIPGLGRSVHLQEDWRAFCALRARLRELQPDVVHTHTAKAGFLGRVACRLEGLRCLHTYHGHVLDGYFSHLVTTALVRLERAVSANHHHQALTPSQMLDLSRGFRIGRRHTWHSLPVPVPPVKPQPYVTWAGALRRRTPVVGFLGRLVPIKDVDLYLATLAELSHHRPMQGLICGDGPLREHAEFRAAELGLRVHFTGFIPAAEALGQMDVLLMTSRNEGQPLVAIEAASAGVPVVAPAVGGLADLIRWGGVAGAAREPAALAAAVDRLISDPEFRQAQVVAGQRLAARLTPAALAPHYRDLYELIARTATLLLVAVLLHAAELKPQFTAAATGDLLTFVLVDPPAAWAEGEPAQVKFIAPDGRALYRSAYRTAAGWQVRHVARQPGHHSWKLLDPAGSTAAEGALDVTAGSAPAGPLGVNPRNHHFLAWADGTPFVPIGPNIGWMDGDPVAGFTRAFTTLAAQGGTHARIWMCSWGLGIEGERPGEYQYVRADQLDAVLASARAHGIHVTIVLDNHTDVVSGHPFPYGEGIEQRQNTFFAVPPPAAWRARVRYCLARWGADDTIIAWELMNEVDLALPVRDRAIPWVAAAAEALQQFDADHRLHTVSWCGADWPVALASPAIDLLQLHRYVLEFIDESDEIRNATHDGVEMLIPDATRANTDGRPWFLGEMGYQGTDRENRGNDLDEHGLLLRQQTWAGFLLGGCGSGMNWWWDTHLEARGLWNVYKPFAECVARLDLNDPELVPLRPNAAGPVRLIGWASSRQALLWPQLRSDTWYAHLMGKKPRPRPTVAQPIMLGGFVSGRRYHLVPYDQVSGAAGTPSDQLADQDGRLTFKVPPGTIDVVWHVVLTAAEP